MVSVFSTVCAGWKYVLVMVAAGRYRVAVSTSTLRSVLYSVTVAGAKTEVTWQSGQRSSLSKGDLRTVVVYSLVNDLVT